MNRQTHRRHHYHQRRHCRFFRSIRGLQDRSRHRLDRKLHLSSWLRRTVCHHPRVADCVGRQTDRLETETVVVEVVGTQLLADCQQVVPVSDGHF